jgi:hypothetical protein
MRYSTYLNNLTFINLTLSKRLFNKHTFHNLATNHLYNIDRLSFIRVKAVTIVDVEALIEVIEKYLLIRTIEIEEC